MASSLYATLNMLKTDFLPFKEYCLKHDLIIKDELAKALKAYLESKTK